MYLLVSGRVLVVNGWTSLSDHINLFDIPSFFCYIVTHDGQKSKKNKQNINKPAEINLMAQHEELLITQILNPERPTAVSILPTPASAANNAPKHNHPRFGAKRLFWLSDILELNNYISFNWHQHGLIHY